MSYETVGLIFALGVIFLHLDILIIIGAYLFAPEGWIMRFVKKHALKLVLLMGIFSMIGSLTYSEVFKFTPCKLCWLQRIFLYPSVVVGLIGVLTKDRNALRYTLVLSSVGIVISAYHYFIQMSGVTGLPCTAVGQSDACSGTFVKEFGYITIPLMALTLNLYIIVISWVGLKLTRVKE